MIPKRWKNLPKQLFKYIALFFIFPVGAYEGKKNYRADEIPHPLKGAGVTEKTGGMIDLSAAFQNSKGDSLILKDLFDGKPVLLTVVYYNCPGLCNFHLNGLFKAMGQIPQTAGRDYNFIAVSMDSRELPRTASAKKSNYLKEFKRSGQFAHFLTGTEENIKKLTQSLGFSFRWDDESGQFAHTPVAYLLSPEGRISRYLYGVEFVPNTLRLSLIEAGRGQTAGVVDRILLFCYRFNPEKNRYTLYAYNIMRAGAGLMAIVLLGFLVPYWFREGKKA